MSRKLSRRDFLKTAAMGAVGVAAMGAMGVSAAEATPVTEGGLHSWEVVPDPIPESEITASYETEVLIVGGGYAGAATAASCCEQGLKVLMVEKSDKLHGNGIGGTGALGSRALDEYPDYSIDKPLNMARWVKTCGGRCRESLVAKYFRESERCMNWLLDLAEADGARCLITANASNSVVHREEHAYHWILGGGANSEYGMARGVPYLLLQHAQSFGEDNMIVHWNTAAKQLLQDEGGRVIGAVCETEDGYVKYLASKAVVLATGDISFNDEMMEYFAPIGNKTLAKLNGCQGDVGDGHLMGAWVGGAFQDAPWPTMMHPQAAAGFHGPFLFVNPEGKRFMNEATWVQGKCVGVIENGGAPYAWSVFDKNWPEYLLQSLPYGGGMFWDQFRMFGSSDQDAVDAFVKSINGGVENGSAYYKCADTLEELAEVIGVPQEQFLATIARYNEVVKGGEDLDFYKETPFLTPVEEGPFYACMVGAGLLVVVGGLHISDDFEVMTKDDEIIAGLYAVGNASGDLYAYDYPINIQGNSHGRCLCWGKLLGEHLATV